MRPILLPPRLRLRLRLREFDEADTSFFVPLLNNAVFIRHIAGKNVYNAEKAQHYPLLPTYQANTSNAYKTPVSDDFCKPCLSPHP